MRPRLQTIDLITEPPESRVRVELELPGRAPVRGTATGAATAFGQARTGAEATIDALRDLLPQVRLVLDEVVVHEGVEGRWVTVLATALGRVGVERLVGSALVEAGVHRAAVHATLQACNRRLGHPEDGGLGPTVTTSQTSTTSDRDAAVAAPATLPEGWRDPMAVLLGTLRLLRRHVDELDDAERLGLLDAGIAAADRLVGTVADAPVPQPRPRSGSCHAEATLTRAVASARATAGPVRIDCPADTRVAADPDDLHRMVAAAVEAVCGSPTTTVAVEVAVVAPWVRLTVHADDPAGSNGRDDRRSGQRSARTSGFDLEVVRLLAEANGGAATVESDGAQVHAVRVRLPVA